MKPTTGSPYSATITVSDPAASNNPRTVAVTLYVYAPTDLGAHWRFDESSGTTASL